MTVQGRRATPSRRTTVNSETLERYLIFGETLIARGRATVPALDGLLALPGVIEVSEQDEVRTTGRGWRPPWPPRLRTL